MRLPGPEAWKSVVEDMVSQAADAWHSEANRLAMQGRVLPFYLYYRESTETEYGALYMVPEGQVVDRSWTLAAPEAFRADLTRDEVRKRIREVAWWLPILPSGEEARA